MEIKYFNVIERKNMTLNVNPKVAHCLEESKRIMKQQRKERKELGLVSLDKLVENGYQAASPINIEEEYIFRSKEEKYLNSHEYKRFRKNLQIEIVKRMDKMSKKMRAMMYLRYFKGYSISKIADEFKISKGAAQEHLRRGTGYIKDFLEADIKAQDEYERRKKVKKNF